MSWCKLDDQYTDHPKIVKVGPLGMALHVACMCYCARYLTDGFIPAKKLPTLVNFDGIIENGNAVSNATLTQELINNNLLDVVEGGYYVHDYLIYNPPAEQVKAERQANAARQAAWKIAHPKKSNGVSNTVTTDVPSPSPSLIKDIPAIAEVEEKVRTKTKEVISFPEKLNTETFKEVWSRWEKFRSEIKKKITPTTRDQQFKLLSQFPESTAIAMIEQSITNSWTGIFPVKNIQSQQNAQPAHEYREPKGRGE